MSLDAPSGCRALVEIRAADALNARSDGQVIQVNYGLAAAATDDELAVVFAHEMAHLVLEHRRRLEAAGVEKGFFGEFGTNQQLNRQVEVEADRDLRAPARQRRLRSGDRAGVLALTARAASGRRDCSAAGIYPSSEARAQLIEREIADYLGGGAGRAIPGTCSGGATRRSSDRAVVMPAGARALR